MTNKICYNLRVVQTFAQMLAGLNSLRICFVTVGILIAKISGGCGI